MNLNNQSSTVAAAEEETSSVSERGIKSLQNFTLQSPLLWYIMHCISSFFR